MQRRKWAGFHLRRRIPEPLQTQLTLAAMAATAATPLLLLTAVLPRAMVLPTLCLMAIAGATVAAFVAWQRHSRWTSPRLTAWDVAGGLAFIACAAAILSNPEQVVVATEWASSFSERPRIAMAD